MAVRTGAADGERRDTVGYAPPMGEGHLCVLTSNWAILTLLRK